MYHRTAALYASSNPTKICRLLISALLICMVLGAVSTAHPGELLTNTTFALGLEDWRKAPALKDWSPLSGPVVDLNPSPDYRGDLLWQPLNVVDPAREIFTFQVDISRVDAEVGSAASFFLEYVDADGKVQRASLLAVSNTLAPTGDWLSLERQWLCPAGAQRLIKFGVGRCGTGHLQMRSPSLFHPLLENSLLPTILNSMPVSGEFGTSITITGAHFGDTPGGVFLNRVGNDDSWEASWTTALFVQTWSDTSITARVQEPNASGELTIVTAQGLENRESITFTVTSPYFTVRTLSPKQSTTQGMPLIFTFEVEASPGNPGYPEGIFLLVPDADEGVCTVTPDMVFPTGDNPVVLVTVSVNTKQLPAGRYRWFLQSIETSSYARFSGFQFDLAARGESPRGTGLTPMDSDGAVESAMGLPRHRVNLATLDLLLDTCLFRMKTQGPPIRMDLWFLGRAGARNGLFGEGWRMSYESSIDHDDRTATLFTTKGKILVFATGNSLHNATEETPVTLTPPAGNFDSLICYGTWFEYVEKGAKLRYRYDQNAATNPTAYLTLITDRNNQTITVQTDLNTGQIAAVSDEVGRAFTFVYDGFNHCISAIAPDSRAYRFTYLGNRISHIEDPEGYNGSYTYDAEGFMTLMSIAGKQMAFTYAARPGDVHDKYLKLLESPEGRQVSYAFKEGESGVTLVTDSRGNVRENYTSGDKPTLFIDPTGELRQMGYENELPTSLVDADGAVTHMSYDANGNLTRVVDALGEETLIVYDADNNLTSYTNALGDTWTYEYDSRSNLIKVTYPDSSVRSFSRDAMGRIVSMTDRMHHTTRIAYDTWGNPATITDPLDKVATFQYDPPGMRLKKIIDANGDVKEISYDGLDRITSVAYRTSEGNLVAERSHQWTALGETRYTNELGAAYLASLNLFGQTVSITDPLGAITAYEYDTSGNRVKITDPLGRISTLAYDAGNRLTKTVDPLDQATLRFYDATGRLKELRDPRDNSIYWKYDARGHIIQEWDAAGEVVRIDRDALGRASRTFNSRDQEIIYTYDPMGRMTRKVFYGLGVQYDYVYNNLDSLASMTGPDGVTTYEYTSRKELLSITYPNSAVIRFSYDDVGSLASITYPDGLMAAYQYDSFNRIPLPRMLRNAGGELTGFNEPAKKPISIAWTNGGAGLGYNAAAMPIAITRQNGVETSLDYDAAGRCVRIRHISANATMEMTMQYNPAGELTGQGHTDLLELPEAKNGVGNFNALDQIVTWNDTAYIYDKDGNLTEAGGRFSAVYDPENRLISLTRGSATATFAYNGLGQRVSRVQDGVATHYLYDRMGRLLCITDGAGNVLYNIIYAGGAMVAFGTAADGFTYPLFDVTGNIIALTNENGAINAAYRYLPFGGKHVAGDDGQNPFTYSGMSAVLDQGDGLYAMGQRFYDALTAKFMQRDPIGVAGGINRYAYSDNSPVLKSDPGGQNPLTILMWGVRARSLKGTLEHGAKTVSGAKDTVNKARETWDSYQRAKNAADSLRDINNSPGNSLEEEILRQDKLRDARQNAYNRGVETKDEAIDTAGTAADTVYHGARFLQGMAGLNSPMPEDAAAASQEILMEEGFNELDHIESQDWESIPDL